MRREILWVDNDPAYLYPYRLVLEAEGYSVTVAETVSKGEALVRSTDYALVILDVMIPVTSEDEVNGYSAEMINAGYSTGLTFYVRQRDCLAARDTPLLVLTSRIDENIAEKFKDAGLPGSQVVSKLAIREPASFLKVIRAAIA